MEVIIWKQSKNLRMLVTDQSKVMFLYSVLMYSSSSFCPADFSICNIPLTQLSCLNTLF